MPAVTPVPARGLANHAQLRLDEERPRKKHVSGPQDKQD
jgi:hypothetical protein